MMISQYFTYSGYFLAYLITFRGVSNNEGPDLKINSNLNNLIAFDPSFFI